MSRNKRHNAKGRTKQRHQKSRNGNWIPNEPYVIHSRSMLNSPAFWALSINARKILVALELDHMGKGGAENGRLNATHDQLRELGLSANSIRTAIEELETFGLIRYERGGRWGGTNRASLYRLTYLQDSDRNPPTDEWRGVDEEKVRLWKIEKAARNIGRAKWKATRTTPNTERSQDDAPDDDQS